MSDLEVNAEALQTSATTLRLGAAAIPTSSVGVDASLCGSPTVISAAEEFSLWAALTAQGVAARLRAAADTANQAAAAYSEADQALADAN